MPLSERSLIVWRAVAARGPNGVGSAQIHDHFSGRIDRAPLTSTLKSLRLGGFLRSNDNNRHSIWWATDKVPLGEELPAWLNDAQTETDAELDKHALADQAVASAMATAAPWPFGKLGTREPQPDGVDIDAAHELAATPRRTPPEPWFALDSEACLSLRADDVDGTLSADATRALFRWLDGWPTRTGATVEDPS